MIKEELPSVDATEAAGAGLRESCGVKSPKPSIGPASAKRQNDFVVSALLVANYSQSGQH